MILKIVFKDSIDKTERQQILNVLPIYPFIIKYEQSGKMQTRGKIDTPMRHGLRDYKLGQLFQGETPGSKDLISLLEIYL